MTIDPGDITPALSRHSVGGNLLVNSGLKKPVSMMAAISLRSEHGSVFVTCRD